MVSRGERERPSRFVEENEWQGTRDPAAYLSVRAECHTPTFGESAGELLREARRRIQELTGLPPICPDSPEWYAQMASFPLAPCDAGALQRRLHDEYRVEVPVIGCNGRQLVRVSIQGCKTPEDVEALLTALRALLPEVAGESVP